MVEKTIAHAGEQATAGAKAAGARSPMVGRTWVRWNSELKTAFLDHLAATCNVNASAAAIGVHRSSVYQLRRKDAAFATDWGTALHLGYQMLETRLVGFALSGGASESATGEDDMPNGDGAFDFDQALKLLAAHRQAVQGQMRAPTRRGGPRVQRATSEETDAAILKQLAALDRRLKSKAAT